MICVKVYIKNLPKITMYESFYTTKIVIIIFLINWNDFKFSKTSIIINLLKKIHL